jgi:uncharacterized protein
MQNTVMGVYLMAGLVALLIGLGKGGLGGTLGVLSVPLLSLVLPVQQVVGLLLPVLIVGDVFAISAYWRKWDTGLFVKLIPGGALGTLPGTFILVSMSPVALRVGLAIFILLFAAYRLFFEKRLAGHYEYQLRTWHGWLAGALSGVTSSAAHAGGAPVAIYLLLQDTAPGTFVATSALFFAVLNLVKIPSYLIGGVFATVPLHYLIGMVPLLPFGVWLGKLLTSHVERTVFDKIILALLGFSAVLLLVT